jgi:hypothetical protein
MANGPSPRGRRARRGCRDAPRRCSGTATPRGTRAPRAARRLRAADRRGRRGGLRCGARALALVPRDAARRRDARG